MPEIIYHIVDPLEWETARSNSIYRHPSLPKDGFIHCSTITQLENTANLYFGDDEFIHILVIDCSKVNSPVKYEMAARGGAFPHIYGPLNLESVKDVIRVDRGVDGKFKISV